MPYLILIIILIFFSILDIYYLKTKQSKKKVMLFLGIIYIFFFGLRGFLAWDWLSYYPNFNFSLNLIEAISSGDYSFNVSKNYDVGYKIYVAFIKCFTNNYHIFIFITTIFDCWLLFICFIRYSPYPVLSLFLFLVYSGFQLQYDLLRNIKATLLFFFSIYYLEKNKKIIVTILLSLEILFHSSSIVYLPLCLILKKNLLKYKKIIYVLVFIGSIILITQNQVILKLLYFLESSKLNIFLPNLLLKKMNNYLDGKYFLTNRGIGLAVIEKFFLFFLIMKNIKKISKIKYGKIFMNMWILLFFLYLYTNDVRIIEERFSILIVCSYWLIYPFIVKIYKGKIKIILVFIILSYSSLKIYRAINENTKSYPLMKYENILFNSKSFEEKKKVWIETIKKYQ
jgi:hypothetical protein